MIAEMLCGLPSAGQLERLQWGRDQMIAEILDCIRSSGRRCHASMGPRSNDRGNAENCGYLLSWMLASMGPRSNDRGNRTALAVWSLHSQLQWGRDQMIAEMRRALKWRSRPSRLQWGR